MQLSKGAGWKGWYWNCGYNVGSITDLALANIIVKIIGKIISTAAWI